MSNKSAVDFLFERLWEAPKDKFVWYGIFKEAKEMEYDMQDEIYEHAFNYGVKFGETKTNSLSNDDSDNVEYKTKTK